MALFTDGLPASIEFLRSFESGILDVAETEGIDLDAKLSLARDETADVILRFLLNAGTRDVQQQRQALGVADVVVTPALRRLHALRTLEYVYRDAFGHQLNDRYGQKLKEYQAAVPAAEKGLFEQGVGLVSRPVPKAPTPVVTATGDQSQTLYLAISYVSADGAEGAASDALMTSVGAGGTIPGPIAVGWTGNWNVYAGSALDSLLLQTDEPVPSGTNWVYSGVLKAQGRGLSTGQVADSFVLNYQGVRRG